MKIPLSCRLQACCRFISPGDRVADIGCDHGYLSIHLLKEGIASHVIAADINPSPLQNAVKNSEKFGVRDQMRFYLSDGVKNIPRDFDTLVCAGMGGDTMISILSNGPWLKSTQYKLVLQCQSKTPMLRQYLVSEGWHIQEETVLRDGKFLYTVMEVKWQPDEMLSPGACYFPPALLVNPSEDLPAYFRWVITGLETVIHNRREQADPFQVAAYKELIAIPEYTKWLKEESL